MLTDGRTESIPLTTFTLSICSLITRLKIQPHLACTAPLASYVFNSVAKVVLLIGKLIKLMDLCLCFVELEPSQRVKRRCGGEIIKFYFNWRDSICFISIDTKGWQFFMHFFKWEIYFKIWEGNFKKKI